MSKWGDHTTGRAYHPLKSEVDFNNGTIICYPEIEQSLV